MHPGVVRDDERNMPPGCPPVLKGAGAAATADEPLGDPRKPELLKPMLCVGHSICW